jgi:nicotinamidase-related amidase
MPPELPDLAGTTLVTMELQRGVVGDLATLADLAAAARERAAGPAWTELVVAARQAGVPIVHCRVQWRPDRVGSPLNTPLVRALERSPGHMLEGTEAIAPVAELGDTTGDLCSVRRHGMGPFTDTDLDPLLRSLRTTSVVAVGVSLNVGVLALCLGAIDRGYRVIVPADAVVGVPPDYGDMVLRHSLAPLATLTDTASLCDHWSSRADPSRTEHGAG